MLKNSIYSVIIFFAFSCGNGNVPSFERQKTPEELKMELLAQERETPLLYLTAYCKLHHDTKLIRSGGLFRDAEYAPDGGTIKGTIKNSATMAQFKDIVLTVNYYSQTQTLIESKDYIIYEFYNPQKSKHFELKVYPPEAMKEFGVEVKTATSSN